MRSSTVSAACVCAVLSCLAAAGASEQVAADEARESVTRGRLLFQAYCVACHGAAATGDGPSAAELKKRPADLTRLRREEDGEFPTARLHEVIDGRLDLAGHGSREMPVWGLTFLERSRDDSQEREVVESIDDLVAYLRSIQVADR